VTKIRIAGPKDWKELAVLLNLLWPEGTYEEHLAELEAGACGWGQPGFPMDWLVAEDEEGVMTGFLQVGMRSHADGCDSRHAVGYVEGWYVREAYRGKGIGRALMGAAEEWARAHGCREMASDALIENVESEAAHIAMGYEVVDRCILFRKTL
jgi:aminoglycoside 6'-N-acetyltransferase I